MKSAYLVATAICLAAASAAGAQTTPKPVATPAAPVAAPAAPKPVVAPAAPATAKPATVATPAATPAAAKSATVAAPPVAAPVVSPIFAPAPAPKPAPAAIAAPAPRPAPVAASNADPVETWVRKMITHHRAAISMAETMMNNTQDREAARVAKSTYYREQRDVTTLQSWLRRHGKAAQ